MKAQYEIPKYLLKRLSPIDRGEFLSLDNFNEEEISRHRRLFNEIDREAIFSNLMEQPHLLISTPTGNGKSTLIKSFINYMSNSKEVYCYLVDIKGETWGSLDKSIVKRIEFDNIDSEFESIILEIEKLFNRRKSGLENTDFPDVWLILEEYNSIIMELGKKQKEKLEGKIKKLLYMGRAYRIHLCIVAQSHLVKNVGLDRQIQQNMEIVALGQEKNNYKNIYSLLADAEVFASEELRKSIGKRLEDLRETRLFDRIAVGSSLGCKPIPDLVQFSEPEYGNPKPIGDLLKLTNVMPDKQKEVKNAFYSTSGGFLPESRMEGENDPKFSERKDTNWKGTVDRERNSKKSNAYTIIRRLVSRMKEDGYSNDQILKTMFQTPRES